MALEALFPGDRLSRRQFRHHLASPRAALRVIEAADAPGRLLGYHLLLSHARRRDRRLYSLVVHPDARGQGLGARLLQDALDLAASRGGQGLRLEVREDNAEALALYRRHELIEIDRRPGYYQDGAAALRLRRGFGAVGR